VGHGRGVVSERGAVGEVAVDDGHTRGALAEVHGEDQLPGGGPEGGGGHTDPADTSRVPLTAERRVLADVGDERIGLPVVAVHGQRPDAGVLVDQTVAVVVDPVGTVVARAGVDGGVGIVAVGGVGHVAGGRAATGEAVARVAVAVAVAVVVAGDHVARGVARASVAVVVDPVVAAGLRRAEVDRAVAVVAVGGVANVARGRRAIGDRGTRVALAVTVGVGVEGGQHPLVDVTVAVVVHAVADLGGGGVDGAVGVVAVVVVGNPAGAGFAGRGRASRVAVGVAIVVRVEGRHQRGFVGAGPGRLVVAIVELSVADFGRVGVDGGIGVVAVGIRVGVGRERSVLDFDVVVDVAHITTGLIHDALGVDVVGVAKENDVVAVDVAVLIVILAVAVTVFVIAVVAEVDAILIDDVIAVVVDPVGAELLFARIDVGVGVVAVDTRAVAVPVDIGAHARDGLTVLVLIGGGLVEVVAGIAAGGEEEDAGEEITHG